MTKCCQRVEEMVMGRCLGKTQDLRQRVRKIQHAFTMVELLVVIAILSVLAAMLFPALQNARKHALSTSCMSNLKQVGTATHVYVRQASRGWMPVHDAYDDTTGTAIWFARAEIWPDQLVQGGCVEVVAGSVFEQGGTVSYNVTINAKQVKEASYPPNTIFFCPSSPPMPRNPYKLKYNSHEIKDGRWSSLLAYGMRRPRYGNEFTGEQWTKRDGTQDASQSANRSAVKLANLRKDIPFFADSVYKGNPTSYAASYGIKDCPWYMFLMIESDQTRWPIRRHMDRFNSWCPDGSTRSYSWKEWFDIPFNPSSSNYSSRKKSSYDESADRLTPPLP